MIRQYQYNSEMCSGSLSNHCHAPVDMLSEKVNNTRKGQVQWTTRIRGAPAGGAGESIDYTHARVLRAVGVVGDASWMPWLWTRVKRYPEGPRVGRRADRGHWGSSAHAVVPSCAVNSSHYFDMASIQNASSGHEARNGRVSSAR